MHKTSKEKKREVIRDYAEGKMTVSDICRKHGIARRTVYTWAEKAGIKRNKRNIIDRKAVYLSRNEVEAILLLMLEGSDLLSGEYRMICDRLEERLLDIADMLEEQERKKS